MSVEFVEAVVLAVAVCGCLAYWLPMASLNGLCIVLANVPGCRFCRSAACIMSWPATNGDGVSEAVE